MPLDAERLATSPITDERTRVLVHALAAAVDAKGRYEPSHSYGVARLAYAIARLAGINGEHAARIWTAGLLHDVGKLHVPDSILLAPRALTDSEMEIVRQHPEASHSMLKALALPLEARWVLHHHEAGDGSGYPTGLAGDAIPLESRIILLADAYDVLIARRPYKAPVSSRDAFSEVARCSGRQFDSVLVAHLEQLVFYATRAAS